MPTVFVERPTADSLDRLGPVKRFLLIWTPALIGIAIIATESQPTFSAANTSSWLRPIYERFFGRINARDWAEFHHILRKTGHFTGYGILCVLFLRGWLLTLARNVGLRSSLWRWRSWIFGLLSTIVIASGDELHQTLLPSRTGLFSDVVIDTCGGIFFSSLVMAISWCIRRIRSNHPDQLL